MKISALLIVYNEASRLPGFMAHAVKWADEIVVADKSSTDNTAEIARCCGAKVVTLPFSPCGHTNPADAVKHCRNDWVWLFTPGEVPTQKLVTDVNSVLDKLGDSIDLVIVPKKLYSFGIHDRRSPWSSGHQPFVIHRTRAKIQDRIHANFAGRGVIIPWAEDCCILHPTHATVESFLESHTDYILKEAMGQESPEERSKNAAQEIKDWDFGYPEFNSELFGQWCAWRVYQYGVMLACWEKSRGHTAEQAYLDLRKEWLKKEWGIE